MPEITDLDEAKNSEAMDRFGRMTDYAPDMFVALQILIESQSLDHLPKTKETIQKLLDRIDGDI